MKTDADPDPIDALEELLVRLRSLLARIPPDVYTVRPAAEISGSIGQHVRHCLDHVAVLVRLREADCISYDHRTRSTADESERLAAITRIDALTRELAGLRGVPPEAPVLVDALLDPEADSLIAPSSIGRELAFVVHHTIHHFAVIALLLDRAGVPVPARFAHAPSTLKAA